MGILSLQRNNKWRIEIRETWKIPLNTERKDFDMFIVEHKIKHNIDYDEQSIIFKFDDSSIEIEEFKQFLVILNKILMFKEKFGQLQ